MVSDAYQEPARERASASREPFRYLRTCGCLEMADDRELKQGVTRMLEQLGFAVQELPRLGDSRSADLLAVKEQSYLIELKERLDDPTRLAKEEERLAQEGIADTSEPAGYKNRVSGIIVSGVDQLRAHQGVKRDFDLLWLHSSGRYPDVKMRQFRATLYGTTNIYDLDGDQYHRPCYYFYNSEFFRHADVLDGAILSTMSAAQLCINDLSPRVDEFRESTLTRALADGVLDPRVEETQRAGYIADTDIDRKDSAAVLEFLREKYGRKMLSNIELGYQAVTVAVSGEEDDQ